MKYKYNWGALIAFILIAAILDILFMPVVCKYLEGSIMGVGLGGLPANPVHDYAILNWNDYCFNNRTQIQITLSIHILFFIFLIWVYVGSHKKKDGAGDEYGSARFMTDDEFDKLIPHYLFRPNEQACERKSDKREMSKTDDSKSIFEILAEDEEVKA